MLAACGDGRKLKPTIIFKGKGTRTKLAVKGANIMWSDNGWINESLCTEWLKVTLSRFVLSYYWPTLPKWELYMMSNAC